MKKRIVSLLLIVWVCVFSASAFATGLDDLLGGLNSLFSSDEETFEVGELVELDGLTIKLVNVLESTGNSYYTPAAENEFLIFEFEIENLSEEELTLSTVLCFSAWCDDKLYTISLEALSTAMLSGKYQLDCVVEPGESVTGVVGYEVPKDWENAKVEFTPEALFGEKVSFAVSQ